MPDILVVDDSVVDRRLVGGLLEKEADTQIRYAEHGLAALEQIRSVAPDLVVTDLMMPEMNGLELVAAVREQHPLVPVILMTSRGSEETAVEALKQGASSYVPKRLLARNLLDTINSVLNVSSKQIGEVRLRRSITRAKHEFSLENDCQLIPPLVGFLQEQTTSLGLCDHSERIRVGVALEEALMNALYHGNLEISSKVHEMGNDAFFNLVRDRTGQPPYRDRRIYVSSQLDQNQGVFVVRDEGPGFEPETLPDPTDPENLEKVSGRGVLLMRTFMDGIEYNTSGNEVTMVKRCPQEAECQA